jgi:hypothetical protein
VTVDNLFELSVEQEFQLRSFAIAIKRANAEQAQDMAVQIYRQMLLRDNAYKVMMKDCLHPSLGRYAPIHPEG